MDPIGKILVALGAVSLAIGAFFSLTLHVSRERLNLNWMLYAESQRRGDGLVVTRDDLQEMARWFLKWGVFITLVGISLALNLFGAWFATLSKFLFGAFASFFCFVFWRKQLFSRKKEEDKSPFVLLVASGSGILGSFSLYSAGGWWLMLGFLFLCIVLEIFLRLFLEPKKPTS